MVVFDNGGVYTRERVSGEKVNKKSTSGSKGYAGRGARVFSCKNCVCVHLCVR